MSVHSCHRFKKQRLFIVLHREIRVNLTAPTRKYQPGRSQKGYGKCFGKKTGKFSSEKSGNTILSLINEERLCLLCITFSRHSCSNRPTGSVYNN